MSTFGEREGEPSSENDFAGHEDRLTSILADPSLPDRDKRQAIQDALDDLQRERGEEPAAPYEPLEQRFFEALAILAEGGHDYDGPSSAEEEPPPSDPPEGPTVR